RPPSIRTRCRPTRAAPRAVPICPKVFCPCADYRRFICDNGCMHDLSVITLLAGALAVALVMGWATQRLGLSTLVGYVIAGIAVGPHTPGFVADAQLASQMAEIGVI